MEGGRNETLLHPQGCRWGRGAAGGGNTTITFLWPSLQRRRGCNRRCSYAASCVSGSACRCIRHTCTSCAEGRIGLGPPLERTAPTRVRALHTLANRLIDAPLRCLSSNPSPISRPPQRTPPHPPSNLTSDHLLHRSITPSRRRRRGKHKASDKDDDGGHARPFFSARLTAHNLFTGDGAAPKGQSDS